MFSRIYPTKRRVTRIASPFQFQRTVFLDHLDFCLPPDHLVRVIFRSVSRQRRPCSGDWTVSESGWQADDIEEGELSLTACLTALILKTSLDNLSCSPQWLRKLRHSIGQCFALESQQLSLGSLQLCHGLNTPLLLGFKQAGFQSAIIPESLPH